MSAKSVYLVVIQNQKTQLYLQAGQVWTQEIKEAANFKTTLEASAFAVHQKLSDCDIVMHFGDAKYDVRVEANRQNEV